MLKTAKAMFHIAKLYVSNKQVEPVDYSSSYDAVSNTYKTWNAVMGKHSLQLVSKYLPKASDSILDFACGDGFLTELLLEHQPKVELLGLDISEAFIQNCQKKWKNQNNLQFIACDGLDFLNQKSKETYDYIYALWSLPYFNNQALAQAFYKNLKKGGRVVLISNKQGTLKHINTVFRKLMLKHSHQLIKIMKISKQLPKSAKSLSQCFENEGFQTIEVGEDVEWVYKENIESLHSWLKESGVLAGTEEMFLKESQERVRVSLLEEMKKAFVCDGQYRINHAFVFGCFEKV